MYFMKIKHYIYINQCFDCEENMSFHCLFRLPYMCIYPNLPLTNNPPPPPSHFHEIIGALDVVDQFICPSRRSVLQTPSWPIAYQVPCMFLVIHRDRKPGWEDTN